MEIPVLIEMTAKKGQRMFSLGIWAISRALAISGGGPPLVAVLYNAGTLLLMR